MWTCVNKGDIECVRMSGRRETAENTDKGVVYRTKQSWQILYTDFQDIKEEGQILGSNGKLPVKTGCQRRNKKQSKGQDVCDRNRLNKGRNRKL